MGTILVLLGGILTLIGAIWLLVEQFKESLLWGFGCLFIPILSLRFVVLHWDEGKKPFAIYLIGLVSLVIGSNLSSS